MKNVLVMILVLVALFYCVLVVSRERLLFYRNSTCGRYLNDREYRIVALTLEKTNGWWVRKQNMSYSDCVYVIVTGAGGAKCCYTDIIKSCLEIDPNATVCIIDHLGYGDTRSSHTPSIAQVQHYIQKTRALLVHSGFRDIVWVPHCIGTILLLKTPHIFDVWDGIQQRILIINGLVDWYYKGVDIVKGLRWVPSMLSFVTKQSIRNELDARTELSTLIRMGIQIIALHTKENRHVPLAHGQMIRDLIGHGNYYEIKRGRHVQIDLAKFPEALQFVRQRFALSNRSVVSA